MVDITEISAIVAAAGVLIGVVLAVLELEHCQSETNRCFLENLSKFQHEGISGSVRTPRRKISCEQMT